MAQEYSYRERCSQSFFPLQVAASNTLLGSPQSAVIIYLFPGKFPLGFEKLRKNSTKLRMIEHGGIFLQYL